MLHGLLNDCKHTSGVVSVPEVIAFYTVRFNGHLEMRYSGNGKGVIADCHYYDRKYKTRSGVIPETLSTVFFNYNRQAILDICNNELNTAFTHIIFVTDGSLNIDNKAAICGHL